ncbi:MAG: hypothetical protein DRO39_01985 [Thermoprotei archaeon]|nr:MAG: hypothetical protein DRO39_01985 [Thermoprotei archaeon]
MNPSAEKKREYVEMIPPAFRDACLNVRCGDLRFSDLCRVEIGFDIERRSADLVADFHLLPFRDGSFGAVIAYDVLEHTTKYGLVLEEVHRVLRKNGYLVLSTVYTQGYAVHADPQHVHCYTEELLRRALARHGFRVLRMERYCPEGDNIIALAKKISG